MEEHSQLKQFHGIPDRTLMHLAARRTGLPVRDRWVAIALLVQYPTPIPVPRPAGMEIAKSVEETPAPKLTLIQGGKDSRVIADELVAQRAAAQVPLRK